MPPADDSPCRRGLVTHRHPALGGLFVTDRPDGKDFREYVFTAVMDGPEGSFDGFTIPASCRAGWWHCPDHCEDEEFIRFTLDHAGYL